MKYCLLIILDTNFEEQPGPSEQTIIPEIVTDSTYWNSQISKLFLVGEMPKEFYDFWFFCRKQCPAHPEGLILIKTFFILNIFNLIYILFI